MKKINKLYIIIAIIIIIGTIICKVKGFNIELEYLNRQEINLSISQEVEIQKIKDISKSELNGKKFKVKRVGNFNNAVKIICNEITAEEKNNIINKINEEYKLEIVSDEIEIFKISNTKIRDIIKPYILPGIITLIIVVAYFMVMYNKIEFKKVLLMSLFIPFITELTYYSIIAIARIPFGRVTNSIAIGIYTISILVLTAFFQKEKTIEMSEKEND